MTAAAAFLLPPCAFAQHDHIAIWSTEENGGALTLDFGDIDKVYATESFCTPDNQVCFYTSMNPAFLAPTVDRPGDDLYRLADGTSVSLEVITIDSALSLVINAEFLGEGDSALLGTMPQIHNHPTWQFESSPDLIRELGFSYYLTTDSPLYRDSGPFVSTTTNAPRPPVVTPTPDIACAGDCDGSRDVTAAEVVAVVQIAMGGREIASCPDLDVDGDGVATDVELAEAISLLFAGCATTRNASFAELERTIFAPICAQAFCHDSASRAGDLDLSKGAAFTELVDAESFNPAARRDGLLRVEPGVPNTSFLVIKLEGPTLEQGSPMPLVGDPLTAEQIDLIRRWIEDGANP